MNAKKKNTAIEIKNKLIEAKKTLRVKTLIYLLLKPSKTGKT